MFISLAGLIWSIVAIPIIFYVIYRLSTMSKQLEQIAKHLNIQDDDIVKMSNEEIEKELEENFKK